MPFECNYWLFILGTTTTFGIEMGDMHTYDNAIDANLQVMLGFAAEISTGGLVFSKVDADVSVLLGAKNNFVAEKSSERASNRHYEYSITFENDFSTSSDPEIAGQPSDVIVGGGVNVYVAEALEGIVNHNILHMLYILTT
jgi:hypothetical protein